MEHIMNTYARLPVTLVEGKGSFVWDSEGKKYIDFVQGIAVNTLGHCHPEMLEVISEQSKKLIHVSNLYWNEQQIKLSNWLSENSIFDRAFFCNSGAEANEAAIKLARKYGKKHKGENCYKIITMEKSFHGRTLATLTATGQEKVQIGFEPLPEGFIYTPFNDITSLKEKISDDVCAIMLELVQGEGGVNVISEDFLEEIKKICDENDILLIIDEVQTGMGRTGKLFCYENFSIEPDIITLAKGLGGGLPIGALLAKEKVAEAFSPGDHGSTFGGNPLVCAVALKVGEKVLEDKLLENAVKMGSLLCEGLKEISSKCDIPCTVRGLGLLVGIEFKEEAAPILNECLKNGLLLSLAGKNVLRFLPPLNVTEAEIKEALNIIETVFKEKNF